LDGCLQGQRSDDAVLTPCTSSHSSAADNTQDVCEKYSQLTERFGVADRFGNATCVTRAERLSVCSAVELNDRFRAIRARTPDCSSISYRTTILLIKLTVLCVAKISFPTVWMDSKVLMLLMLMGCDQRHRCQTTLPTCSRQQPLLVQ